MKVNGKVEVYICSLFISEIGEDGWLASHSGRFTPLGKSTRCLSNRRLGGPQGPIWKIWRTEIRLVHARNRTTIPRTSSPWPSHYTDYCVIPVPLWTVRLVNISKHSGYNIYRLSYSCKFNLLALEMDI